MRYPALAFCLALSMHAAPGFATAALPPGVEPGDEQGAYFYVIMRTVWLTQRFCADAGSPHAGALQTTYDDLARRHADLYRAGEKQARAAAGSLEAFDRSLLAEAKPKWDKLGKDEVARECEQAAQQVLRIFGAETGAQAVAAPQDER